MVAQILDAAVHQKNATGYSVALLVHYGLRLGALVDVSIHRGEYLTATTKGGNIIRLKPSDVGGDGGLIETLPPQPTQGAPVQGLRRAVARFLEPFGATPHDLRHAFAVTQYMRPGDVFAVSRLLGHQNIGTTQSYLGSIGIEVS